MRNNAYKLYKMHKISAFILSLLFFSNISYATIDFTAYTKRIGDIFGYTVHDINGADNIKRYCMSYPITDTIQLRAVRFFARAISGDFKGRIRIYEYANGVPGAPLATKNFTIKQGLQIAQIDVNLNNPLVLTDTFCVAIELKGRESDLLQLQFSVIGVSFFGHYGRGYQDKTWKSIQTIYGATEEPNVHLEIEYTITPDFTIGGSPINQGDTLNVYQNYPLLLSNTTNVIFHYMFSYRYIHPGDLLSWDFGNGASEYHPDMSYAYADTGLYMLTLTDNVELWDNTLELYSKYVYINVQPALKFSPGDNLSNTEIEEFPAIEDIIENRGNTKMYPNPTDGLLNIDVKDFEDKVTMQVYDNTGKLVKYEVFDGSSIATFDLSFLSEGIYIVHLNDDSRSDIQKIQIK